MPLFVCDVCDVIENTAVGFYWERNYPGKARPTRWWKDQDLDDKALCSACTPEEYADGSKAKNGGKWHGRFPQEKATVELIEKMGPSRFVHFGRFAASFPANG